MDFPPHSEISTIIENNSDRIENFEDLCRFCLNFVENSCRIPIDSSIRENYKWITNTDLIFSEYFPEFFCEKCFEDLKNSLATKERFLECQKILENSYFQRNPLQEKPNDDVSIKQEDIDENVIPDNHEPLLKIEINKFESDEDEEVNDDMVENEDDSNGSTKYSNKESTKMRKIQCSECGIAVREDGMGRHIEKIHKKVRNYCCNYCSKKFHFKFKLQEHVKSHFGIKDISCDLCNMKFPSKSSLLAHQKILHENHYNFSRICEFCGKSFTNKSYYENHMKSKHGGDQSQLYNEDDLYSTIELKNSKKQSRSGKFNCSECPKAFSSTFAKNRHLKSHKVELGLPEKIYPTVPCPDCGKIVRKDSLRRHTERVHLQLRDHVCDICGRSFYSKTRIIDHIKSHMGIKDINCEECGMKFSSKGTLRAHINIIHKNRYVRTCDLCGKSFPNKSYFETHMRAKHTGERSFACEFSGCEKSYFSKADLTKHQKDVHMIHPEVCPVCLKTVKNLSRHKKYHEERRFVCELIDNGQVCGKKFVSNHMLKKHVDIKHRGIRNYMCNSCEMCYTNNSDLQSHIRNIHQKRKIKCELCSSLLGAKEYYRKHVMLHHKETDSYTKELLIAKIRDTREEDLFNYQK